MSNTVFVSAMQKCKALRKEQKYQECCDELCELIKQLDTVKESTTRRGDLMSVLELLALAHNEKGEVLYRMVEFDLAISEFDMALTYNQRLPAAFYNRGLIHYRMGRFETASRDLKDAIAGNPFYDAAIACLSAVEAELAKPATVGFESQQQATDCPVPSLMAAKAPAVPSDLEETACFTAIDNTDAAKEVSACANVESVEG